jgi:hypothetical protein
MRHELLVANQPVGVIHEHRQRGQTCLQPLQLLALSLGQFFDAGVQCSVPSIIIPQPDTRYVAFRLYSRTQSRAGNGRSIAKLQHQREQHGWVAGPERLAVYFTT